MPTMFIRPPEIEMEQSLRAIFAGMAAAARMVRSDMAAVTQNWLPENQPNWIEEGPIFIGDHLAWSYTTTDEPFVNVDHGTVGHFIKGHMKPLKMRTGFRPATVPNALQSMPGQRFGGWRSPHQVYVKGIKARNFSQNSLFKAVRVFNDYVETLRLYHAGR